MRHLSRGVIVLTGVFSLLVLPAGVGGLDVAHAADPADLRVTKVSSPQTQMRVGERFKYTIIAENLGPFKATDVDVNDTIITEGLIDPDGCSLAIRTTGGAIDEFDCNFTEQKGVFDLGEWGANHLHPKAPDDEGRMIITIEGVAVEPGDITNRVTVTSDSSTEDPDTSNNVATDHLTVVESTCRGVRATISGSGDIEGSSGDDVIVGSVGPDDIDGFGGNDLICGGDGVDSIDGGAGDDQIFGEGDDDLLLGGDGADALFGGSGNDDLRGQGGDDDLRAHSGNDLLLGGDGADALFGGSDDDDLRGQGGDDVLRGQGGDDDLRGNGDNDLLLGGPGVDGLFGGSGQDDVRGQGGDDHLRGNTGNDLLLGGPGGDDLFGGSENDRLRGHGGPDLFDGGPGVDHCIDFRSAEDVRQVNC